MSAAVSSYLGWAATVTFVASYFFVRPVALRAVQMLAALMWVTYGFLIGATPVIAANVLVIIAAAWTATRGRERARARPRQKLRADAWCPAPERH